MDRSKYSLFQTSTEAELEWVWSKGASPYKQYFHLHIPNVPWCQKPWEDSEMWHLSVYEEFASMQHLLTFISENKEENKQRDCLSPRVVSPCCIAVPRLGEMWGIPPWCFLHHEPPGWLVQSHINAGVHNLVIRQQFQNSTSLSLVYIKSNLTSTYLSQVGGTMECKRDEA